MHYPLLYNIIIKYIKSKCTLNTDNKSHTFFKTI